MKNKRQALVELKVKLTKLFIVSVAWYTVSNLLGICFYKYIVLHRNHLIVVRVSKTIGVCFAVTSDTTVNRTRDDDNRVQFCRREEIKQ